MHPGLHIGKYHKLLFYSVWLLLNLIQSAVTGLFDDEAYYWVYSRSLDWGYFDHPPMIAVLIKVGYAILPNELGVRFLIAILSTATLWLVEQLLTKKDDRLFYSVAVSIAVLQIGGILAVPDVPLLFFTAVFFHAYKNFIEKPSLTNCVFIAISMALLLYSKYHGVLVIIFTLASNPRLFLNRRAYLAVAIAIILFLPHLYWQYIHGYPSLQYHLKERVESSYRISFTLDYIFQQLVFAGPLATVVLFWAMLRKKASGPLERALKFTTVGFYLFFLVLTSRGNAEANWTFPAFIGLIALSHQYLAYRKQLHKLVHTLALLTLCIVILRRIYMVGLLPPFKLKGDEFLYNREWTQQVSQQAEGLPVFFIDSYQRASKYWFYSGHPTYSLNTFDYRRNNFNFWEMEDTLHNKSMYGIYQGKHEEYFTDSFATSKGIFLGRAFDPYFSFSRIWIKPLGKIEGRSGQPLTIRLFIKADEKTLARIHPSYDSAAIWIAVYRKDVDEPAILRTNLLIENVRNQKQELEAKLDHNIPPGQYTIRFGVTSCIKNWPSLNSSIVNLAIK